MKSMVFETFKLISMTSTASGNIPEHCKQAAVPMKLNFLDEKQQVEYVDQVDSKMKM